MTKTMSARDVETLLNTPKLFIFLPVVNYVYLTGETTTNNAFILCILAVLSSAFIYNTLDGIPVERAKDVRLGLTVIFGIAVLIWISLLYKSAKALLDLFYLDSIVPEILFFTTVVFSAIAITHMILLATVAEYENKV